MAPHALGVLLGVKGQGLGFIEKKGKSCKEHGCLLLGLGIHKKDICSAEFPPRAYLMEPDMQKLPENKKVNQV